MARFEYIHIVNLGPQSEFASLATECAGDQGAWWDFHDFYFEQPGREAYARDGAIAAAAEFGLDTDQFAECLDSQAHLDRIIQEHREAASQGLARTPTVVVNGEKGPTTADALIDLVKELAQGAG